MARNDKPKKESKGKAKGKSYPAHLKTPMTGSPNHSGNAQTSAISAAGRQIRERQSNYTPTKLRD